MNRVFLSFLEGGFESTIRSGFSWLGTKMPSPDDKVAIKPNLTFPVFRPGVMTTPEAVEAMVRVLKDYTPHITVCEADSGGYNRFSIDEVFDKTGLREMAKRYGIRVANLSNEASRSVSIRSALRSHEVPLTRLLMDETDLFITMPVPKIHMNTKVSMSVKNQWGTIQIPAERLKLHPYLKYVIYDINKRLPRAMSFIDGSYGLTRSGPMKGDPVPLNWMLASENVFAADAVCCDLMGIDPFTVDYLAHCLKREHIESIEAISTNVAKDAFRSSEPFFLRRAWTDYPGLFAFHSRVLAYIGYESPLATILHKLLYLFREPFYDYQEASKKRS